MRILAYFCALGLGFICLEISLLQRFVLFLGFPTYSLSVVLFSLLLWTGLGSALSSLVPARSPRAFVLASAALVLLVCAFQLLGRPVLAAHLSSDLPVRIAIAAALLMPFGVVLWMFFPLGLRVVQALDTHLVPWAWGINACATVVGTIASAMLAMSFGFDVVMLGATLLYAGGAVAIAGVLSEPALHG